MNKKKLIWSVDDTEIGLYTPYKQVKAILLKRYSVGAIKPPRLEILNLKGCESYKQSIQEQNIILVTGGESLNSPNPKRDWVRLFL